MSEKVYLQNKKKHIDERIDKPPFLMSIKNKTTRDIHSLIHTLLTITHTLTIPFKLVIRPNGNFIRNMTAQGLPFEENLFFFSGITPNTQHKFNYKTIPNENPQNRRQWSESFGYSSICI